MLVKCVEDLRIYQIALELAKEIEVLVKDIPFYWNDPNVNQIRRSVFSVPSNIAEGFSQRFYKKKYILYLNIALGSSDETKSHLRVLYANNLLSDTQFVYYEKQYKYLSIKILNLINYERGKISSNPQ